MIPILLNRWVQLAAGTALALVFGFGLGHHQKTLEDASAALSGAKRMVQTVAKQSTVNATVDQKTVAALSQTQDHTTALVQKVPIYVTRKADDQCIVGVGAVRLLNDAAGNTIPGAPGGLPDANPGLASPDADSGVTLSSIVQTDIVNAGSFNQLAERVRAWEDWYDGQAKLH